MFPAVTLEVGFFSDPSTPINSTIWTDISPYLLDADWDNGGRQYELDQAQAGTMSVKLYNSDRRFEPEYASGAYYPNVVPLRRIRLRIGENTVTNPSFETDTSGWSVGAQFTIARSTIQALMGVGSLKSTFVSGSASTNMATSAATCPTSGRYAFSAFVYIPAAWNGGTVSVNAENFTGAAEVISERHDANLSLRDQWQRIWRVYDISTTGTTGNVVVRCASFPTGTPFIYIDGAQVASYPTGTPLVTTTTLLTSTSLVTGGAGAWAAGSLPQPYVDQVRSVFTGFVESWPPAYQQRTSFVTVSCVDGFEPLANATVMGGPNMIRNSSFETDATQWTVTTGTLARDTAQSAAGTASGKFTAHASSTPAEIKPAILGIQGSTYYAATVKLYIPSGLGITAANVTAGFGITGGAESSVAAQSLFDQWQTLVVPALATGGGETGVFGNTALGNSVKQRLSANYKFASPFDLPRSGVVTDLRVDVGRNNEDFGPPPGQLIRGVIYSDSAGSPNTLLGTSDEVNRDSWNMREWLDLTFSTGVALTAGTYWLGIHAGAQDNGSFFYFDTLAGKWAYNFDTYADGAGAGFGTATTQVKNLSIYATYTAGVAATDGYAFVRMAETGITKFIYVDEMVVREVLTNELGLVNPVGADLDVALVSLRMNRVLDAANWPIADRAIDTGIAVLAATVADATSDSKALSHLQDDADAELGVFFCDGNGKATFHDRNRRFNPVPVVAFTDSTVSPGVFPYREGGLVPSYDKTRIANDVRVTPAVGEAQIVTDAASQTKYLQRTLSKSLPLADESQANDLAQGILTRTKDPHLRFERLSLAPVAHEATQPGLLNAVLAREVSDCVAVKFTPPGGGAQVSKNVHLEKASFRLEKPAFLNVDWQLSPVDSNTYWTIGDPAMGMVSSGNKVAF
jgi:hypothetical protein